MRSCDGGPQTTYVLEVLKCFIYRGTFTKSIRVLAQIILHAVRRVCTPFFWAQKILQVSRVAAIKLSLQRLDGAAMPEQALQNLRLEAKRNAAVR